jgi:hypothetical protein
LSKAERREREIGRQKELKEKKLHIISSTLSQVKISIYFQLVQNIVLECPAGREKDLGQPACFSSQRAGAVWWAQNISGLPNCFFIPFLMTFFLFSSLESLFVCHTYCPLLI